MLLLLLVISPVTHTLSETSSQVVLASLEYLSLPNFDIIVTDYIIGISLVLEYFGFSGTLILPLPLPLFDLRGLFPFTRLVMELLLPLFVLT